MDLNGLQNGGRTWISLYLKFYPDESGNVLESKKKLEVIAIHVTSNQMVEVSRNKMYQYKGGSKVSKPLMGGNTQGLGRTLASFCSRAD